MSTQHRSSKTKPAVRSIEVTNIRGVKHVNLGSIERHLVVIGGTNGSGKTSLATAVRATVGGMRGVDCLLREGAQIGACVIDLGDRKIVRTVKRRKDGTEATSLEVVGIEGQPEQKPQERMDRLVRPLSFDPMTFFQAHPNEQTRILLAAVGVDYTGIDKEIQEIEQERVLAGRDRDKCKGALAKYPPAWNPPTEPLDAAELSQQMAAALRQNAANAERRRAVDAREARTRELHEAYEASKRFYAGLAERESQIEQEIARLQAALAQVREQMGAAEQSIAERKAEGRAYVAETERLKADLAHLEDADTAEIERMIADVETHNEEYRRGQARADWSRQLDRYSAEWDDHTARITELHNLKRKMLADADFPVKGLEIGERGITLDGRPVHLLNTAEQLKIALAIAYAQVDRDLPLIILDQAERLDATQLDMVRDMADEAGVVTLAMRVATGDECTIVLDNGQVIGAEQWADEVLNGPLKELAA